jgi:hypothetical protein
MEEEKETDLEQDLELKDLNQYYGTQNYYSYLGIKLTDGIAYIMRNGYSWFVTDAIAVIVAHPKIRQYLQEDTFLSIKLKLSKSKNSADMIIDDGNGNILYRQHYDVTDAKRELTLFYDNGVLMLSGEY